MVGSASNEEKREAMTRLKVAVVALVAVSAGLIAVSGDGSLAQVAVAVAAGSVVGAALLTYLGRTL